MNGERIKLARKKAGLSLRDLADKMNGLVSAQAIGKYERGEMSPGSEAMSALSKALDVSLPYLMAPQGVELGSVEFRTKASTSAKDRAKVETEVIEWVERYLQIEEILELESLTWTSPIEPLRKLKNIEDVEKLAEDLRLKWHLGNDPLPNLTELLEEKGIKVLLEDLPDKVSGFTCFVKRPKHSSVPVIVVNRSHSLERRRLSMAHELAHHIIAPDSIGEIEKLCQRFAGAFLINRDHLLNIIGQGRSAFGMRELLDLKRLYRTSAATFLVRLEQIGILNHSAVEYAFRTFANSWRTKEPDPLENEKSKDDSETPKRFERLVYRAISEDMISMSKAVELLRLPLSKIENELKGPA